MTDFCSCALFADLYWGTCAGKKGSGDGDDADNPEQPPLKLRGLDLQGFYSEKQRREILMQSEAFSALTMSRALTTLPGRAYSH